MIKRLKILLFAALMVGIFFMPTPCHAKESAAVPMYGNSLQDGSYEVEMTSSSSMFRIVKAELQVTGGNMTAVITLSGTGYLKLFMGTGEEALAASEENFIPFVEDKEFDCAAYSKRKEKWYDRKLSVLASSLPKHAFLWDDGEYAMDVTLDGGSGRATVASPARITVSKGAMVAFVQWSSPDYDYMVADGVKYLPTNTEGNSVFEIPLSALDAPIEVVADTIAMSKPHEIAYTLTFHADTLAKENGSGSNLVMIAVICAFAVVAAILLVVVRNQKKRVQND